jgi:glycosidase
MNFRRTKSALRVCLFLAIFLSVQAANLSAAQKPEVKKLEPPNWWIGMTPNPTMIMLTGSGLNGAKVSADYPGVRVSRVQENPNGKYLFVWLTIDSRAKIGKVPIEVTSAAGSAKVELPLAARNTVGNGISRDDVIYLIMPDRFDDGDTANDMPPGAAPGTYDRNEARGYHGGDLKGIRERLPYLKGLGVTAIWLTPIWANDLNSSDYHGYHPVDFYAVDEHMGTMSDYQDLVAAAHSLGIKVLIDYVVNHTGPNHPWAKNPPTATWLHGTPQNHLQPKYDFWPVVDPHAPPRDSRNLIEGWFADKLPDLNPDDPLLAEYLLENAEWWMESSDADAFRLDTFPYSPRKFWSGWHKGIFTAFPHTFTIGEVWNFDPEITSFFQGGRKQYDGIDTGVTTVFDFPLFQTIRDVILRGVPTRRLGEVLERDSLYPNSNILVTFIGNHDTRRFMGEQGATPEKLNAAFSLLLTLRGIPQIYAGDEIAMPGGDDPDNRRDFPGGFPGDKQNAFASAGRSPEQQVVFSHVQALLELRREHKALREGRQWDLYPSLGITDPAMAVDDKLFAFAREDGQDRLIVVFNNADKPQKVRIDLADTSLENAVKAVCLMNAAPATVTNRTFEAEVPGTTVAIYEVK